MRKVFTIVCRGSWLSLAQVELVRQAIQHVAPDVDIRISIKETAGDRNQEIVLQELEGKDFFTKDIQDELIRGEADLAVHSLKDVSGENFFQGNHYAIIDREDPRDVAIFNDDVLQKIEANQPLVIGTSSPRRVLMATRFLRDALPVRKGMKPRVDTKPIRGNVDTRLRKLQDGLFDGVILAAAGLTRLLRFEQSMLEVARLLSNKRLMVLPLLECPPAPCQGAIVAEAAPTNAEAVNLLQKINRPDLVSTAQREREFAKQYGSGCHQQFGVVHISSPLGSFTFGSGLYHTNGLARAFSEYRYEQPRQKPKTIVYAPDYLTTTELPVEINSEGLRVWTTTTDAWRKLALQGCWVEGTHEGLDEAQNSKWMKSPLIQLSTQPFSSVEQRKHYHLNGEATSIFQDADLIFWTDVEQYAACQILLSPRIQHGCPIAVANEFIAQGIHPICFPSTEAFNQWSKS